MTPISVVYDSFIQKVTDYDFLKMSEEDLQSELKQILLGSLAKCDILNDLKVDFETMTFNKTMTLQEIDIVALGMVLSWIEPQVNSMTLIKSRLGTSDIKFSQANHLNALMELRDKSLKSFRYWSMQYSAQKALSRLKR